MQYCRVVSCISQLLKEKKMHKNTPIVSVPYRGATFLNMSTVILKITCVACFRPLSGSYISQSSTHHSAILHYRFPSPIGELHFSIVRNAYWTKKTISVSVPYRGATFLNDVRLRGYDKRTEVFRPLSGSYISQSSVDYAS